MNVSLEVEGAEQMAEAIEHLMTAQRDWRGAWPALEKTFYAIEARQFDSQGYGKWPALSPAYARAKAIQYPGRPILRRDGFLREAMTKPGAYADAIREFSETEAVIGTALPYAALHQKGAGKLPQRKIIDLQPRDYEQLRSDAQRHFLGIGNEVGFEVYT